VLAFKSSGYFATIMKENCAQVGLRVHSIYSDADNPDKVTIIAHAPSAEQAKSFLSNSNLKQR